jgi:hypothetical protein
MIKYSIFAAVLAVATAFVHYAVPQTDVVRAIGVQTKRVDINGDVTTGSSGSTRDVFYIQTESIDKKKPKVYRNEDNLMYLKWNSADVLTRAQSLASDKGLMAVKHYGWRAPLFSAFPNALKVKPVDAAYNPVPVMFYIVLLLTWGLVYAVFAKLGFFGKKENVSNRPVDTAQRSNSNTTSTTSATGSAADDWLTSGDDDDD